MDQRVGRGVALLFHDRSTRRGSMVSSTPRAHFTPRKDMVPFYRWLGWPHGRSGRAENLVPTGIFFLFHKYRSVTSQYKLRFHSLTKNTSTKDVARFVNYCVLRSIPDRPAYSQSLHRLSYPAHGAQRIPGS